ncbi:MAG: ABC transporter ATP-binding protein, partial [Clostridia bacterium]|nr:ABC transporter ATP-binding protein [Clostridia bacterium]
MKNVLPLLIAGAIIGTFTVICVVLYILDKRKKDDPDGDRRMKDRDIIKRLIVYAKPYRGSFVLVFVIMLISIAYDVISPLLIGKIEETIKQGFELPELYRFLAVYAGLLIVSLVCTYYESIILQKTGQKILSAMREDIFTHIESLSRKQLSEIPVGKLVTRVTNDPNAISFMFTNIFVNLAKNVMVIIGVLG